MHDKLVEPGSTVGTDTAQINLELVQQSGFDAPFGSFSFRDPYYVANVRIGWHLFTYGVRHCNSLQINSTLAVLSSTVFLQGKVSRSINVSVLAAPGC